MLAASLPDSLVAPQPNTEATHETELSIILRLLPVFAGILPPELVAQLQALPLIHIDALSEAMLDFHGLNDLQRWLDLKTQF
jgi:hypothetical protein